MTSKKSPELPRLIAILRGITPNEIESICEVLLEEGIKGIEIPLNSPDALESIEKLVRLFSGDCLCGAGTVLSVDDARAIHDVGARLSISPNTNPSVIQAASELSLLPIPGVATPSEAFAALQAGAIALKLFPASMLHPSFISQISAVLPSPLPCYPVGGISADTFELWRKTGAYGFGLGSNLYRPGDAPNDVRVKAKKIIGTFAAIHP